MLKSYLFPGQGSQFSGMGKELYESSDKARKMMEKANEVLGMRITDLMFEGTDEDLRRTDVAQPAIYIHSSLLALCDPTLQKPDMCGGHSLGEFSALAASGAISFEDGLRLVKARAEAMQKCCMTSPGKMAAIIGLSDEEVEKICAEMGSTIVPANYNSDGQVVISGREQDIEKACAIFKEAGAKRALPLMVGGAFHSPLMEPARKELAAAIERTPFSAPAFPIYQNVSAKAETDPEAIKKNLLMQLTSPVRWTATVKQMLSDGARSFTEIGPGTVLQGLVKRIAKAQETEVEINGIQ